MHGAILLDSPTQLYFDTAAFTSTDVTLLEKVTENIAFGVAKLCRLSGFNGNSANFDEYLD